MSAPAWVDHEIDNVVPAVGYAVRVLAMAAMWVFASVGPTISVELDYSAPEACPPKARLEAELAARSDKLKLVAPGEAPQAHVSLKVVEKKGRFVGTSKVRTLMSGVTTREFKSAQCETLIQAAALATSLLLDPEGTRTGAVVVTPPAPPVEVDAGVPVVELVDAGAPADAGVVVTVAEPLDAGVFVVEPERSVAVELWAGGGVTSGISGAIDGLVQLAVSLSWRALSLKLTPLFGWGRSVTSTVGVAQYSFVGGRLDAVASWRVGPLRFEGGATTFITAVPIAAPDAEVPGRALGWLIAPGPLARVIVDVWRLRFALEGGLGINTRTEQYVVGGAGTAAAAPRLFGFASALAGVEL